MSDDERRWRDDPALDPELRALLDAGAAELPHPEQLERLESRLFPPIVPGGGGGAPPHAALGGAAKAALAIGIAAGLGAVVWLALSAAPTTPAPVGDADLAADRPVEAVADAGPASPALSSSQTATGGDAVARADAVAEPEARAETEAPSAPALPAQDPAAELALLDAAQSALDTAPARALTLAQLHARRHPRGALVQEREVIAVDALLRLGRTRQAEARAARFEAEWPTSAHRRRLRVLLERRESP